MSPRLLMLLSITLFAGCVPVTQPVSDIEKSEPDKALVGKWIDKLDPKRTITIDVPNVKGNPKGLMRAVQNDAGDDPEQILWFYTSTIGKHTYANIVLNPKEGLKSPPFHKQGEFEKWKKTPTKRYFIFRLTIEKDALTVDGGDKFTFNKLMDAEKFAETDSGCYQTPAGWLAKYLEKNGPDKIFDRGNTQEFTRAKK
ncbi:MAG: hypothetical protein L0241_08795 [Planctomycetia bacterium]|nr:hypothetical protein [Planctomycetia bacterium]